MTATKTPAAKQKPAAKKQPARKKPPAKAPANQPAKPPKVPSVFEAVKRDLAAFDKRLPKISKSGLAVTALVLARELDKPANSATSKSMCAQRLREALDRLEEKVPPQKEGDSVDEIHAGRKRRQGGAKT